MIIIYIPQGVRILFLAVYTTVHGYVQPYRSHLTNLLEIAVNVNFLLLLFINTTPYFYDKLLVFSSHTHDDECAGIHKSVTQISWILIPVYYLPLLVACVPASVVAIPFLRYKNVLPQIKFPHAKILSWVMCKLSFRSISLVQKFIQCIYVEHIINCNAIHFCVCRDS